MTVPHAALAAIDAVDATAADAPACKDALTHIRRVRGWLDSVEGQVTRQLDRLNDEGRGSSSEDEHGRTSGYSGSEARKRKRRSEALAEHPDFDDSLASGEITSGHVDALAGVTGKLDDAVKDRLEAHEQDLLDAARTRTPDEFRRDCKELIAMIERDLGVEREEQQRRNAWLNIKPDPETGMYDIRGQLPPETGAKVKRAIDQQANAEHRRLRQAVKEGEITQQEADRYSPGRLNAEALGSLVGAGHADKRPAEPDLVITVHWSELVNGGLCETSDGSLLPVEVAQRLACFADIIFVALDEEGVPTRLGTSKRSPSRAQRRALRAIYRTCAIDGCDIAFDRCEIHHVRPWLLGGPTDLDNLVPLCSRHHHRLAHVPGWTMTLNPTSRELTVITPTGERLISSPDVRPGQRCTGVSERDTHRAAQPTPTEPQEPTPERSPLPEPSLF